MSGITEDRNDPGLQEINPDGMQEKYLVLSDEERAKGFIRPVRRSYIHNDCGSLTKMGQELAETYARKPSFYTGTFCVACAKHFNLVADGIRQFKWKDGTNVGE